MSIRRGKSYMRWRRQELLDECKCRELNDYIKGKVTKILLAELLKQDDEKHRGAGNTLAENKIPIKKVPKNKIPVDHKSYNYIGDALKDLKDVVSTPLNKNTLVIGLTPSVSLPSHFQHRSHFTGIKGKETIRLLDLLHKKASLKEIDYLIIYNPSLFRAVAYWETTNLLAIASPKSTIYIRDYFMTHELTGSIKSGGYTEKERTGLMIGSCKIEFRVFARTEIPKMIIPFVPSKIIAPPKVNPVLPKVVSVPLSLEERVKKEMVIENKKKRLLLTNNYDDVLTESKEEPQIEKTHQITLKSFREKIEDEEFIKRYIKSIDNMIRYKLSIYHTRLIQTKAEYLRTKKKIERGKRMGIEKREVEEMYPMNKFYVQFIMDLEDILEMLLKRLKTLSTEKLKADLIDALENPERGLASLVGRQDIKELIVQQLYSFSVSYKSYTNSFNNWCLMGSSGVGKTALAKVIGYTFSRSGILTTQNVKIVTRSDLIGRYIGQTAPKTRQILMETLEGVLFIDEAYEIHKLDSPRDFGSEAITEIVNFLDKYLGCNVVIVAGYEDKMKERFFTANQGLNRRFPIQMILSNYNAVELTSILISFLYQSDIEVNKETANYMYSKVKRLDAKALENQAGSILSLSTIMIKCIHTSYGVKWEHYKDSVGIINVSFDLFTKQM